jgi:serine-type D-Ala-D-Ala carboxypeptidase (penicillin-binding protein 5/6)
MRWLILLFPQILFALQVTLQSQAAILVRADTGKVLFEKNADKRCYPASTMKVATALYVESLHPNWDEVVETPQTAIGSISAAKKVRGGYKCPPHWIEVGGTHISLKEGEKMTLGDLVRGMLVASANDASNVIAHHLGSGSIDDFVHGMNVYMKKLGCTRTFFANPHGLHIPSQQTTARDMALITRHFLRNPKLAEIARSTHVTLAKTNKQPERVLSNNNRLLKKGKHHYPYAIGVKTGNTEKSGRTFVGAASKEGTTLIAVLFDADDRDDLYKDAKKLFEAGFQEERSLKK